MTPPLVPDNNPAGTKTIRFLRRGRQVSLANVPPDRTLLEVLREDLACTGTKEGCGEGDCGACTVVIGEAVDGKLAYKAINSCIRLAHSVDGLALWAAEDIAGDDGTLHPVQEAMVQCHASQCGFCTPGFVMSLFGMYQSRVCKGETVSREVAQEELSGNLCRCTGYRPILDAAQQMAAFPSVRVDEAGVMASLGTMKNSDLKTVRLELVERSPVPLRPELVEGSARPGEGFDRLSPDGLETADTTTFYFAPTTLDALLAARAAHPNAQIVAGCTDVGLWVTKQHRQFNQILDVTRAAELRRIEHYPHHIAIGAAVTLTEAFAALVKDRPQLHTFATRFAGLPVRNSGTLGGNVANGSPIGDSMPLLIAMRANVVLMSVRGHREMPLEALYTGYRQNVMAADEVLAWIKVPKAPKAKPGDGLQVYKISKRFDDDIWAVCLAIVLQVESGRVTSASVGAGGVAATPVRARQTEAALTGQPWTHATVTHAMQVLRAEFSPISDMRASAAYRSEVLGNLLQRYWLEQNGMQQIRLESFSLADTEIAA